MVPHAKFSQSFVTACDSGKVQCDFEKLASLPTTMLGYPFCQLHMDMVHRHLQARVISKHAYSYHEDQTQRHVACPQTSISVLTHAQTYT